MSTKQKKLYDYQVKYLDGLAKSGLMTADVGLGKSPMSLLHARRYSTDSNGIWTKSLVIVAPASKVRSGDWLQDIQDWVPEVGDNATVISYEKFTKMVEGAKKSGLSSFSRNTFIFDEVHYVKNPMSKRGKAFSFVASTAHQWVGLTATPMSNGWHDAANYAIATGLVRNKTEFYRTYVVTVTKVMGARHFPVITGYTNLDRLKDWWARISRPLSREGNLDLPKFIDRHISIKLSPEVAVEQARLVRERTLPSGDMLDSHMKVISALRQNIVSSRGDAIRNILDKTDENIVIFYELNAERDLVMSILKEKEYRDRKLFEQNGHVKTLPSANEPKPAKNAVLLVQYKAGSAGLNLQYASVTIFMSPTYSYQDYHQARGRTDRHGQTKTPVFYHLSVMTPIDTKVWEALSKKKDFSEKNVDISELGE